MGDILSFVKDGLTNLVSGLGTERDKGAQSFYGPPNLTDSEASNAYRNSWVARKIIDIPVEDAFRNWREWKLDLSQVEKITSEEKRLDIQGKIAEAVTQARIKGGCALLIGTGESDLTEPLDPSKIGLNGLKYVNVLDKNDLNVQDYEDDVQDPLFRKPKMYTMGSTAVEVHPSRLVIFVGNKAPDYLTNQALQGWGESVLVSSIKAVKNADNTSSNVASLIFEANVDVISIPDLMANISTAEYEQRLLERFNLAMVAKGNNRTLILDGEEEYEQKKGSFAQLPELVLTFMQLVSGAADIPMTRFMGQSPGGLNSTGESDLTNYYDRIKSDQENKYSPPMRILDDAIVASALGNVKDARYEWRPLWQLTDVQKSTIAKTDSETAKNLLDTGLVEGSDLSEAVVARYVESGFYPSLVASSKADADYGFNADADPKTLYVSRKVLNGAAIIKWAKGQGISDLLDVDDLHVTLIYSRTAVDWIKIGASWEDEIKIGRGGPRLMSKFLNAIVLQFASDSLSWRQEGMVNRGASFDHEEYQPHITVSKTMIDISDIEPYQGEIILGPEIFEELKV